MLNTYNYILGSCDGGGGDIVKEKKEHTQRFGRNVTLSMDAIEVIQGYMHRTQMNFSQTTDVIVKQWDRFSLAFEKAQKLSEVNNIKNAKPVDLSKSPYGQLNLKEMQHETKN